MGKKLAISFTGHRTKELFGTWELNNKKSRELSKIMTNLLRNLIEKRGANEFISGGALGADTIAFICVNALKKEYPEIKNILAIPYKEQGENWAEEDKKRYRKMKEKADEIIYVDKEEKYKAKNDTPEGKHSGRKMYLRNVYMVDHSDLLIAIYDGSNKKGSGTANCYNYAKKKNKKIIRIDPKDNFKIKK